MVLHKNTTGIHAPYSYVFADSTERAAVGAYETADVGKFAFQVSDKTVWVLSAVASPGAGATPTWTQTAFGTGSGGGGGSADELYPTTAVNAADFSWVNKGSCVENDVEGGVCFTAPLGAAPPTYDWRIRKAAVSAPYSKRLTIEGTPYSRSLTGFGIIFLDSVTGKFRVVYLSQGMLNLERWNSATSFSATAVSSFNHPMPKFWRARDDNTNIYADVSWDGRTYLNVFTESRTTFCTPDSIGFGCINNSSVSSPTPDVTCSLISFA